MKLLDRWSYKYGRYAIENLMIYIVIGMAIVFASDFLLLPQIGVSLSSLLAFDRAAILSGQIWRIVTFIFIPPDSSMLFILFSLYFYWLIGGGLESAWGAFKFNIYYLVGILGTIIAGMLTGYATNYYLNMSLFFAFAALYPDFQVLLFFILPIRIKWLALLDALYFLISFIFAGLGGKIALLVAVANFLLFFGGEFISRIKAFIRKWKFNRDFRR